MSESLKVQPHHVERGAYLYVRQSSMRQVIENVENTKRQYALRSRAIALGWREDQIVVVDSDQGESGASAAWRAGNKRTGHFKIESRSAGRCSHSARTTCM